jgi:hypothetical protein
MRSSAEANRHRRRQLFTGRRRAGDGEEISASTLQAAFLRENVAEDECFAERGTQVGSFDS